LSDSGILGPGTYNFAVDANSIAPPNLAFLTGTASVDFALTVGAAPVPEPTSWLLLSAGIAPFFAWRRRLRDPSQKIVANG
jgi:hypothetical protein